MSLRALSWAAIAALALSVSAPVMAQDTYVAPSVVYTDDDQDRRVDDEIGGGQITLGHYLSDRFALEGIVGSSSLSGDDSLDLLEIGLNGRIVFRRDKRLTPYLLIGFGMLDVDSDLFGDEQTGYRTYGAGLDWNFGDSPFSMRLETRMRESDDGPRGFSDHITSLGVAYAFGPASSSSPTPTTTTYRDGDGDGVRDQDDQCLNTPAGHRVDSRGCSLDGDRDGVADAIDECPNTPAGVAVDARGCELDDDNDGVVNSKDDCPNTPEGVRVDVNGCEITDVIELPGVNFETNSDRLLQGTDAELRDAAATLRKYPDLVVEVAGHTDSAGAAAYNQDLSERRANTVRDYLVNAGANPANLSARGYGEAEPIDTNETAAGRANNRRVELRILEQ